MLLSQKIKEQQQPFIIAGPCSVESESQMIDLVEELSKGSNIQMLRGGIWKPRTRPNAFEGIGEKGLKWLVNAGKSINLPVITEVANTTHLEKALAAGVDAIWIGARTTTNPFSVQEIADVLKGVAIPIFIKNPINPDLNLWIGAIERIQNAGVKDIVAIHRGFSVYQHPKYRNDPNWKIPIALMERMPKIPIICDPSHISGKRNGLSTIAQKAMDLNFNGLMIETHPNPNNALSDAQQQVTSNQLFELIDNLVLRNSSFEKKGKAFITEKRILIETLDSQVLEILKERMQIAEEIGSFKQKNNIPILQTEHWKKMIEDRLELSSQLELSQKFIRNIMDAIHQESIRHQTRVMNKKS